MQYYYFDDTAIYDATVGINNQIDNEVLYLFPNPISIKIQVNVSKNSLFNILDLTGYH